MQYAAQVGNQIINPVQQTTIQKKSSWNCFRRKKKREQNYKFLIELLASLA